MSRENVELVCQALTAAGSAELDARDEEDRVAQRVAFWHPDCEYTSVMAALEPATYHGHDGMRRFLSELAKGWAEWRIEPEDVVEVRPNAVVATVRFNAVGKDSGAPVEARLGSVFVVSQGKLLRGRTYPSREDALEAVGLSE